MFNLISNRKIQVKAVKLAKIKKLDNAWFCRWVGLQILLMRSKN